MTPELSRPVSVDRLPASLLVEADAAECVALSSRLNILALGSLWCRFTLRHHDVVQSCVVSLEPVEQMVLDRFEVRFVPMGKERDDEDPDAPDELPYEGDTIDLGEAATEQLALALDPYPRRPDAVLDPAAVDPDDTPFAGLAGLRRPG